MKDYFKILNEIAAAFDMDQWDKDINNGIIKHVKNAMLTPEYILERIVQVFGKEFMIKYVNPGSSEDTVFYEWYDLFLNQIRDNGNFEHDDIPEYLYVFDPGLAEKGSLIVSNKYWESGACLNNLECDESWLCQWLKVNNFNYKTFPLEGVPLSGWVTSDETELYHTLRLVWGSISDVLQKFEIWMKWSDWADAQSSWDSSEDSWDSSEDDYEWSDETYEPPEPQCVGHIEIKLIKDCGCLIYMPRLQDTADGSSEGLIPWVEDAGEGYFAFYPYNLISISDVENYIDNVLSQNK